MNRVFVTGDIHGGLDKAKIFHFYQRMKGELDASDVMIVAGDWGYIWATNPKNHQERVDKEKISSKMTWFVVLGNHENYDRIEKLPTMHIFGGVVRFEPEHPNIFYAQNGSFYSINGKRFWCMGGGFSIDKHKRTSGLTWWQQEVPPQKELDSALKNFADCLSASDCVPQYIVTHTCPLNLQPFDKFMQSPEGTEVNKNLEIMLQKVWDMFPPDKPEWFCGHFHIDEQREIRFLYNDILEI